MRRLHHDSAERAVLGSIMLDGETAYDATDLDAMDFFNLAHRTIFAAMARLRAKAAPPGDLQLLEAEIPDQLEAIGGLAYLGSLVGDAVTPSHLGRYVALVREAALTRLVVGELADIQDGDEEGDALLERFQAVSSRLSSRAKDASVTIGQIADEAMVDLESAMLQDGTAWGIPTGFGKLDYILGGLQRGALTIFAARPSMGKSALVRSIADNVSSAGVGVHVFSPEDSRRTYALRTLADRARASLERVRGLRATADEMAMLKARAAELRSHAGWLIDDTAGISSREIAMRVRRRAKENNTGLVIVDYVQLLREREAARSDKRAQIDIATENLEVLARSEKIAVIAVSQLNRECEKRPGDKRPLLADLRESGGLEQAAEAAVFLYRDEVYNADSDDKGTTELLIRKNKNGRTGCLKLFWDAECATHRPLSRRES